MNGGSKSVWMEPTENGLDICCSSFARKYIKTNQDSQLAKWQGTIRDIEKNNKQVRVNILRPYQKSGVARINLLHELGCHPLLADEMGLGKTIQALALISVSKISDLPNLVVCPASVVPVWVREARTHFPNIKTSILSKDEISFPVRKAPIQFYGWRAILN